MQDCSSSIATRKGRAAAMVRWILKFEVWKGGLYVDLFATHVEDLFIRRGLPFLKGTEGFHSGISMRKSAIHLHFASAKL